MTAEATFLREQNDRRLTAAAAIASGEVYQLADGRAAVKQGLNAAAANDAAAFRTDGIHTVTKKTAEVWIDGAPIYWDHSANNATCLTPTGDRDFFLGTCVGDVASTVLTGNVNINEKPVYIIDSRAGVWTNEATNGLGTTLLLGGGFQMAFDAVAEAAQAANYSLRTFTPGSKWVLEGRMAIFDIGDDASLDIDVGVASGSHATDFQSVAEFATLHFDGSALDILVQSDDGSTDVAPEDTTINAVDDTYFDFVIDGRTLSSIKAYVNGVLDAGATAKVLSAAAGPLKVIAHMEKTSNDTTADVRIDFLRLRIAQQ